MAKKRIRKFWADFKTFIAKGNVVDLAVAVIIGSAFNKIVTSLVNDIIMPLVSVAMGQVDFKELGVTLVEATDTSAAIVLKYGVFIQYVIDFLIIAFTVFLMVRIFTRLKESMDFNANMAKLVQEKLNSDKPLNDMEVKWLKYYEKKYPQLAPKKQEIVEEKVEEVKLSKTEELLTEILKELKKEDESIKN